MSRRTEKKFLRRKVFGVMQNISQCFAGSNPFATPIPPVVYTTKIDKSYDYKFTLAEPYIVLEKKIHQFLAGVEKDKSAASFNRAIFGCEPEFDGCETGCIDMLHYYLEKLTILELRNR